MLYHILDMTHSNNGLQPPKYQQILENIKNDILSGRYQPGQKLPSEAALLKRFGASRITVGRALRELQQAGLVQRRKGSGTYVGNPSPDDDAARADQHHHLANRLGQKPNGFRKHLESKRVPLRRRFV